MEYINKQIRATSEYLPNIRPLTEFIHFNLYQGLQKTNFWKAIEQISLKFSVLPLPHVKFYQERCEAGLINPKILDQELIKSATSEFDSLKIKERLHRNALHIHLPEKTYRPLNKQINEQLNYSLKELSEPLLIRFLSAFYDQGVSDWRMPHSDLSLLDCFMDMNLKSYITMYPIKKSLLKRLSGLKSNEVIDTLLSDLFDNEVLKSAYIEECLLSLKGWSAFIHSISQSPKLLQNHKKSSLEDYIAIRLIIERAWIDKLAPNLNHLKFNEFKIKILEKKPLLSELDWTVYKIWHESLEKSLHFKKIYKIQKNRLEKLKSTTSDLNSKPISKSVFYDFQAIFCIDDRLCSFRRNLESLSDKVQTFGTPGHFGLDFSFKENKNSFPSQQCPAPVTPKYLIQGQSTLSKKNSVSRLILIDKSKDKIFVLDMLDSFVRGVVFGAKLFAKVFLKKNYTLEFKSEEHHTEFEVLKNQDEVNSETGFTPEQAAERLSVVFKTMGLTTTFSNLVYVVGHESTTTNNPYFNAYGCGACSGRSGHINAIVFSRLANNSKVRTILSEKYLISIPAQTHFVGAVHNTTKDTLIFFDEDKIPKDHEQKHLEFKKLKQKALIMNSELRSHDFELIPKIKNKKNYLNDLSARAYSIFEPRPELGHTGNAFCVVASRSTTRGISFDRRAFLQSYDWSIDPDGVNLNTILSAAIPVCGGINLDYLFARMNSENIGAGSKLSHNIVGLTALSHGTEDDLLPGLAGQMVELHDPIRMLFVIEQKLSVVESVINQNLNLKEWVYNEWVRVCCLCPVTMKCYFFENGQFSLMDEDLK